MTALALPCCKPQILFDNSHPIGKGPKEGKERYTLFVMRDPDQPETANVSRLIAGTSLESLAEKSIQFMKENPTNLLGAPLNWEDVIKNNLAAATSDLRVITPLLNQIAEHAYVVGHLPKVPQEYKFSPIHKDAAVAFANNVNALVKKRNDKIEESTWIAFLDIVLKILTFGLFHFKEGLKAPTLNPLHWANACNPNGYKFTFEKNYPALSSLSDSSNPATVFRDDITNHQRNLIERFFTTKDLPSSDGPTLQALMGQVVPGSGPVDNRPIMRGWSQPKLDDFTANAKEFTQIADGSLSAPLLRIEEAFALGCFVKGRLSCRNDQSNMLATIEIRKIPDEGYALLIWDEKSYSYKVGSPLNIAQALPEHLRHNATSFSVIPLK